MIVGHAVQQVKHRAAALARHSFQPDLPRCFLRQNHIDAGNHSQRFRKKTALEKCHLNILQIV